MSCIRATTSFLLCLIANAFWIIYNVWSIRSLLTTIISIICIFGFYYLILLSSVIFIISYWKDCSTTYIIILCCDVFCYCGGYETLFTSFFGKIPFLFNLLIIGDFAVIVLLNNSDYSVNNLFWLLFVWIVD